MSARRWWVRSLLAAALVAGTTGPARAQTVVAWIGGQMVARQGQTIDVPVTVDLSGAPGQSLGSYRGEIQFDPIALSFSGWLPGTFAAPQVNEASASSGLVRFTAVLPAGAPGPVVTLFVARFSVAGTTSTSLTLSFDEMSAAGMPFTNLLPYLQPIQPATLCPSIGTWGDADLDGNTNSRDALIALSRVVGIAMDTTVTDPQSQITTVTMRPGLADVDGDGRVTSRDALIIMSYAVGLPVTGYRIGLAAAGACGSWAGVGLRITPDTVELQSQQTFDLTVTALDSAGRSVAVDTVRWTSSNPAVAAVTVDSYTGANRVFARDSGWAVLSAEVGAGHRASAAVHVIAHRSQWYVDIRRAGQTSYQHQTGDQRLPFAFIQDALNMARDLDTINVAFGVYPEAVSSDISVFLRGDAVNRPVIDPRGADSYSGSPALSLGSRAGTLRIENFRVVGGAIEAYAAAFVGRNLLVDSVVGRASVYVYGTASSTPSGTPSRTPSVDLDGIEVRGFQDRGIWIEFADSVVIQHSSVQGDPTYPSDGNCYSGPGGDGGGNSHGAIMVDEASYSRLVSNTVTDARCDGIAVFQAAGQAVLSGNRVTGAGSVGILVSVPQVALDHNAVRDVRSPDWNGRQSAGIRVSNWNSVENLTSLADTVLNVGGSGFLVDTLLTGVVDSLVVDGTGVTWGDVSPANYSHGAALYAGHYTVRYAKISNTREDGLSVCGPSAALFSQGNHVTSSGYYYGITTRDCYVSEGGDGPDTLVSFQDTVEVVDASSYTGILAMYARYARVDSAVVSGTGTNDATGIDIEYVDTIVVRNSKISNVRWDGIYVYSGVSALLERDTITSVGGSGVSFDSIDSTVLRDSRINITGAEGVYLYGGTGVLFERDMIASAGYEGLYLEWAGDTTRVRQTVVTNSGSSGVRIWQTVLRADTIAVTGNGGGSPSSGLSFDGNSGGRITGSRLEGNSNYGVHVYYTNYAGVVTLDSLNSLADNVNGTVNNLALSSVYAQHNWWGAATGPVQSCEGAGPLCVLGSVDIANPLPVRPTFPLAPPAQLAGAVRPVASSTARAADGSVSRQRPDRRAQHARISGAAARPAPRPLATRQPPRPAASSPTSRPTRTVALAPARSPMVSYRKGAPPRPVIIHHPL